ncbi:MAG: nucleotidyl transferase AbiEii/AbiGii toxin family protein, partial [Bdellovibrionota bacterium]
MNRDSIYFKRASLMTRALPAVATESCFALKGGTAICFFHRDLPRLSVDIDLTYLPTSTREDSISAIGQALERIAELLKKQGLRVEAGKTARRQIHKLFVSDRYGRIKIEPNFVLRGTVHPVERCDLTPSAEEAFETSVTMQVASVPDLYGGKLCAALDRQHPRDLFDVRLLLANEGITEPIRRTFVVYLACTDRPINELINPSRIDIAPIF